MHTYQAMWAIHTLFCLLVLVIVFKKENQSSVESFQLSYPHPS